LALAVNEAHNNELQPTTLDTWEKLGLPWVALWLKDLLVWGTLDPVTAYLLGRGRASTRSEAGALASQYYTAHGSREPDEQLDPKTIRAWADKLPARALSVARTRPRMPLKAKLERAFPAKSARRWRVLPAETGERIFWIDAAGYVLASGERPPNWVSTFLDDGDFFLDVDAEIIEYEPYL
jgi:hypothetical protein